MLPGIRPSEQRRHLSQDRANSKNVRGIHLLIINLLTTNFNFLTPLNLQFFISLNLTNLLRRTISTQLYPKITKKFTKHPIIEIHVLSVELLDCLKRERDICIKPMLSGAKWHSC